MNVAATAPQLDNVDLSIPDTSVGPGKQAGLPAANSLAFLSLLSWLTEDVLPAPKLAAAPDKKDKPAKPDIRDPQVSLAIELPVLAPVLKPPVVLDNAPPTAAAPTVTPTADPPVPQQTDTPAIAPPSSIAFMATLTDRTKESAMPPVAPVISSSDSKEVPPESPRPFVRTEARTEAAPAIVAAVDTGSPKPQTPDNPVPLRTEAPKAELKTEINTPVRPPPTREISLRLSGAESGSVDVRISERGGKVQVDVRTPDVELARSLRADLGELVGKLDKRGYDAETWAPQNHVSMAVGNAERPQNNSDAEAHQSPGGGQQHSNERRGGRPKHGRGRGFAEVITEGNEENHVNSN